MVSPNEVGCTRKVINVTEYNVKFINHATQKEITGDELKNVQKALPKITSNKNKKPKPEPKAPENKFDYFGVKKNKKQKPYGMRAGGFTKRGGMYY